MNAAMSGDDASAEMCSADFHTRMCLDQTCECLTARELRNKRVVSANVKRNIVVTAVRKLFRSINFSQINFFSR